MKSRQFKPIECKRRIARMNIKKLRRFITLLFCWLSIFSQTSTSQSNHKPASFSSYYIQVPTQDEGGRAVSFTHSQDDQQLVSLVASAHTTTKIRPVYQYIPPEVTDEINLPLPQVSLKLWPWKNLKNNEAVSQSNQLESMKQDTSTDVSLPLVPRSIWKQCNGMEFYNPDTRIHMAETGVFMTKQMFRAATNIIQRLPLPKLCSIHSTNPDVHIVWKPDSKTKQLLHDQENHPSAPVISDALQKEGDILVWTGQFQSAQGLLNEYHGAEFPMIRTTSIVPFSPQALAMLLVDSHRVKEYNKMSIGRTDEIILQRGLDAPSSTPTVVWKGMTNVQVGINNAERVFQGEAKIVRNLTQPPLSNKLLEFITFMYARPLRVEDDVGPGFSQSNTRRSPTSSSTLKAVVSHSETDAHSSSLGYVVVSRAVHGGPWSTNSYETVGDANDKPCQRSEILLSVNLLRNVPGRPNQTEMTTVSHVNVPSVPLMVATPIGIKGAMDFVKDLRSLGESLQSHTI